MADASMAPMALTFFREQGIEITLSANDELLVSGPLRVLDDAMVEFLHQHANGVRDLLIALEITKCANCGWPQRIRRDGLYAGPAPPCRACGRGFVPPKRKENE